MARPRNKAAALVRLVVVACAMLVGSLVASASAHAAFGLESFSASLSDNRAGAHADVTMNVQLNRTGDVADGALRTLEFRLPPGLIGDPTAVETCTIQQWNTFPFPACPAGSQVGAATVCFAQPTCPANGRIFNLASPPGQPARLGLSLGFQIKQVIEIGVRNGDDYGLTATTPDIRNGGVFTLIRSLDITLWGVPADNNGSGGPRRPFMVNPTSCDGAPEIGVRVDEHAAPGEWHTSSDSLGQLTHCESVPFNPSISVRAENPIPDKPSALNVAVGVEQNDDPDGRGASALKDAVVALPEGVTINPSVAHDRVACTDGAFGLRNGAAAACPAGSKIGTAGLDVPALGATIPGDIYLGEPKPGNPFRLFVFAEGRGARVKLLGDVAAHPETGRVTTTFANNPQVPFRVLKLRFAGGSRGVLLMPRSCGLKTVVASFTPFSSSSAVGATNAFNIGNYDTSLCPETVPFAPGFEAGVTGAQAGADTGLVVRFGRPDGHETLSRLKLNLPAGLLGRLAHFPLCDNASANAGTCSEDSLVGGVTVSAGSADGPLNLPGRVFLTEPPKPGQIAGLSIVVPAIVGPYNLGTPVVRAGITVNRDTSLTIESDPFPEIVQGVQLRLKQIIVDVDRPGFMFNPTDCSPKQITGALIGASGTEVGVASPFGVESCAALPFDPDISLQATAPQGQGNHVGLDVTIRPRGGDANMRVVNLVLPSGMGARLDGPLQNPCLEEEFAVGECPAASRVGTAQALTPVLPQALSGPVHLLENANPEGGLPRLAIMLRGAVAIDLVGDVTISPAGRVVAAVPGIPDVPISEFTMSLESGEQAALTGSGELCSNRLAAYRQIIGHNGRSVQGRVPVAVTGCASTAGAKAKATKAK